MSDSPLERDLQFIRELLRDSVQHIQRLSLLLSTWLVIGNGTGALVAINTELAGRVVQNPIPSAYLFVLGLIFGFGAVAANLLVGRQLIGRLTEANTFVRGLVQADRSVTNRRQNKEVIPPNDPELLALSNEPEQRRVMTRLQEVRQREAWIFGLAIVAATFFVSALVAALVQL